MSTERTIQNEIRVKAVSFGCYLMRNNNGVLKDRVGNYVTYGLGRGTSDLIGWTMIEGRAVFTAVEVKRPKQRATNAQQAFIKAVMDAGGIACVATCVDDLKAAITAYISK